MNLSQSSRSILLNALIAGFAITGSVLLVMGLRRAIPEGIRYLRIRRM